MCVQPLPNIHVEPDLWAIFLRLSIFGKFKFIQQSADLVYAHQLYSNQ